MKKLFIFSVLIISVGSLFAQFVSPQDQRVLKSVDFSAPGLGYSTGVVVGGVEGHGQTAAYSSWQRWPDVTEAVLFASASFYSALASDYFGSDSLFVIQMLHNLDTATSSAENGWMMLSLYDQRTPNTGNFNAFIQIDSIDVSDVPIVDVSFYQYYRPYYDHCYLDYSFDGENWEEMAINVSGIDIAVGSSLWGFATYSIAIDSGYSGMLSIRLRSKSLNSSRSAYGYYWIIDDVTISARNLNVLKPIRQEYVEGNYGMIPQGFTVNPAWYARIKNEGGAAQTNLQAQLYHLDDQQGTPTLVSSYANGNIPVGAFLDVMVDRSGWLSPDGLDYRGWYGYSPHTPHGEGVALPTISAGDNYLYAAIATDSGSFNFDTLLYQVTTPDTNGNYRWAHDNGVLTYSPYNYWMVGYVQERGNWYVTEDPEEVQYFQAGYSVGSRYTTDAVVPDNWVVKGVELVASPVPGYYSAGTKIMPFLSQDNYTGDLIDITEIATGACPKVITPSDVNGSDVIGRDAAGCLLSGQYNTVFIPFPEQPALEPNTSYRIGYTMADDGYFALAQESQGSYRVASPSRPDTYDTILYFRNIDSLAKYAHSFSVNNFQTIVEDPSYGGPGLGSFFASQYLQINPMIRMIVGPRTQTQRTNIQVECSGDGQVRYGSQDVCGTTITPAVGSFVTLKAHTSMALELYVDGHHVDDYVVEFDDESHLFTYSYTFENVSENHQIRFNFVLCSQIDPVAAGVRLNLQPNPATSQVALNVEGVNGLVNCQLVDMSGRVVYNQDINAEKVHNIPLGHLAKGAYFVRLTNSQLSKVEKLIVK